MDFSTNLSFLLQVKILKELVQTSHNFSMQTSIIDNATAIELLCYDCSNLS